MSETGKTPEVPLTYGATGVRYDLADLVKRMAQVAARETDDNLFRWHGLIANGLTLAQRIAEKVPKGYLSVLSDGRTYGEALLDSTIIYVPVIDDLLSCGIRPHYLVNITGHGWRKIMRAPEPFVYTIESVPPPQPVFGFMQEHGPVTDEEAYGNLNMGAGFALILAPEDVEGTASVARKHGIELFFAGWVSKEGNRKCVRILPKDITFESETLQVR